MYFHEQKENNFKFPNVSGTLAHCNSNRSTSEAARSSKVMRLKNVVALRLTTSQWRSSFVKLHKTRWLES